jgi:hypothetical protein
VIFVIVMSNFKTMRWISILLSKTGKLQTGESPVEADETGPI